MEAYKVFFRDELVFIIIAHKIKNIYFIGKTAEIFRENKRHFSQPQKSRGKR
jgi:hypothetical protein